jgi:hypothetical protein
MTSSEAAHEELVPGTRGLTDYANTGWKHVTVEEAQQQVPYHVPVPTVSLADPEGLRDVWLNPRSSVVVMLFAQGTMAAVYPAEMDGNPESSIQEFVEEFPSSYRTTVHDWPALAVDPYVSESGETVLGQIYAYGPELSLEADGDYLASDLMDIVISMADASEILSRPEDRSAVR